WSMVRIHHGPPTAFLSASSRIVPSAMPGNVAIAWRLSRSKNCTKRMTCARAAGTAGATAATTARDSRGPAPGCVRRTRAGSRPDAGKRASGHNRPMDDNVPDDPLYAEALAEFARLFEEAGAAGEPDRTAMTVATATLDARPAARTVLLKAFDPRGFVFYTHMDGRKGRELQDNPYAALLFH